MICCTLKATVHYDTTPFSSLDGEWPSIVLKFSNGFEYRLGPLFYAFEDHQQSVDFFLEMYKQLALAYNVYHNAEVLPPKLWEQTDAIMIDAATKNLKIEELISKAFNLNYIPIHLLCKSHTVEALDRSNIEILLKIKKKVKQRELSEHVNPALKSFLEVKRQLVSVLSKLS